MSVTISNATVTFSNMLNKKTKDMFSRYFCVELPTDSPEIQKLQKEFKELEEKAKVHFTEEQGKKVKNASSEKGLGASLFSENEYNPNHTQLKFTIFNFNDVEKKLEDGTTKKERIEKLNSIYKNLDFCYRVNNDGKKEYTIGDTEKHWLPLSENIVDIKCSLVATYNKSDNRVSIKLKADEVKIVKASEFNGSKRSNYLTLSDEDEQVVEKVEKAKPAKSEKVEEEAMFSSEELAELDV